MTPLFIAQIVLTRLRIGWRITAVGGSRRAAYNAGIPVRATVCLTPRWKFGIRTVVLARGTLRLRRIPHKNQREYSLTQGPRRKFDSPP